MALPEVERNMYEKIMLMTTIAAIVVHKVTSILSLKVWSAPIRIIVFQ